MVVREYFACSWVRHLGNPRILGRAITNWGGVFPSSLCRRVLSLLARRLSGAHSSRRLAKLQCKRPGRLLRSVLPGPPPPAPFLGNAPGKQRVRVACLRERGPRARTTQSSLPDLQITTERVPCGRQCKVPSWRLGIRAEWTLCEPALVGWNFVEWSCVRWNCVKWNCVRWNSVERNCVERNCVRWNCVEWNYVKWNRLK
jgi:hypothetical protein